MSDLISRKALINEMCNSCDMDACDGMGKDSTAKCFSITVIEEQPTAYDAEAKIKELEELYTDAKYCYEQTRDRCYAAKMDALDAAISILETD